VAGGLSPRLFAFQASLEAGGLRGEGGYKEKSLDARLFVPLDGGGDENPTLSAFRLNGGRTGYEQDDADPTHSVRAGGGLEFYDRAAVDVDFFNTPAPSDDPGSYRASGGEIAFSLWGHGGLFGFTPQESRAAGLLDTRLEIFAGGIAQEFRIRRPLRGDEWSPVEEDYQGASAEITFWGLTTFSALAEHHRYAQDVSRAVQVLSLRADRSDAAALNLSLLQGFLKNRWGLGLEQDVTRWATLSGQWRRATYVHDGAGRTDTLTARATAHLGRRLFIEVLHETIDGADARPQRYRGLTAGLRF